MSSDPKSEKPKSGTKSDIPDKQQLERGLEEGLEETFPASDPVAAVTEPVVDVVKGDRKK